VAEATITAVDSEGRPRTATTDAAGAFVLEIEAGRHNVWARKGELFGAGQPVRVRPGERASSELEVRRVPAVAGRVLTSRGDAAAGVVVWARPAREAPPFQGVRFRAVVDDRFRTTTSDAHGRFRFEGLPDCALELSAEARDTPPLAGRLAAAAAGEERWIELRLIAGAVVRGVVSGASGGPATQARVSARVLARPSLAARAGAPARESFTSALTDGLGRFELRGLPAGDVWLAAEGQEGEVAAAAVEGLAAGETRALTLALAPSSRISGIARFSDGQPARGLLIEAIGEREGVGFGFGASALTDGDGRFTVGPLAAGPVSLRPGWRWYADDPAARAQLSGPTTVTLAAGEHRTGAAFVLPRMTARIAGTVTDPEGRPAAGAAVDAWLEDAQGEPIDFERRSFTDRAGAFELTGLSDGSFQLRASHPGFGSAPLAHVQREAGRVALQLRPLDRPGK
jgi:hypothetical protein